MDGSSVCTMDITESMVLVLGVKSQLLTRWAPDLETFELSVMNQDVLASEAGDLQKAMPLYTASLTLVPA